MSMQQAKGYKDKILNTILDMSGKYAPYNIFTDWVTMCALAIQNGCCVFHDEVWEKREQLYKNTAARYDEDELRTFGQMFVWLGDALTENLSDVLGEIYMEADLGSKYTGQFFTPFHLSELCAKLSIDEFNIVKTGENDYIESKNDYIELNEPSCGSGGMIIAACKVLHDAGFDYQRRMNVVAQDLDWKGVYMTYLQLSLIGCRAKVVQGDTLHEPYVSKLTDSEHIMRTPALMGALL